MITKAGKGSWVEKEEARQRRQDRERRHAGKATKCSWTTPILCLIDSLRLSLQVLLSSPLFS